MESLRGNGWRLSAEAFKPEGGANPLREALNADLKDVGEACLADLVADLAATGEEGGSSGKKKALRVPDDGLVLQVGKLRNLSAPKVREESQAAPRMLKLSLTDGHSWVHGVEVADKLPKLDVNTPPGTKVRLLPAKEIPYVGGFLQFRPQHLEVLGGKVEALVEKWEISRKLAQFTRAKPSGPGGPPSWVPFGKKIKEHKHEVDKNFKAMSASKGQDAKERSEDQSKVSEEFNSQRQDAIEEAAKQGGKKVFGGGKAENIKEAPNRRNRRREEGSAAEAPLKETRETKDQRPVAAVERGDDQERGKGRKKGRRGRDDDEEGGYEGQKQPSSGVSLFDFLEKEFPGAHDVPEDQQRGDRGERPRRGRGDGGGVGHRGGERHDDYGGGRGYRHRDGDDGGGRGGRRPQQSDRRDVRNEKPPRHRNKENQNREEKGGDNRDNRRDRDNRNNPRNNPNQRDFKGGRPAEGDGRRGDFNRDRERQQQMQDNYRGHPDNHRRPQQHPQSSFPGGPDRDGRGGPPGRDGNRRQLPPRQQEGGPGNRPPRQQNAGPSSDRDFGEWSNSTYHDSAAAAAKRRNHAQGGGGGQQQQQQHLSEAVEGMNIHDEGGNGGSRWGGGPAHHRQNGYNEQQQQPQNYRQQYHQQQHYGNKSSSFGGRSDGQSQPQGFSQRPPRAWREGDQCLAKYWEDGKFYQSVITALSHTTAVVLFKEYGNHEEVLLSDLAPVNGRPSNSSGQQQGFIPVTPGLPPAFPQQS